MWTNQYNTKATIELRELVNNGVDLWDFDYPSYYKGDDKKAFEQKVIDHFYFRQIGFETVGRFLHYFRTRMKNLMPFYIDMYKSVEIMHGLENPFDNVDVTETFEQETTENIQGETSGTEKGDSSTTTTNSGNDTKTTTENRQHKFSNTPQGAISNLDNYMTEVSIDTGNNSDTLVSSSEGSGRTDTNLSTSGTNKENKTGTLKTTFTKKGNQGVNTYAHDMIEFRKSIINVDEMILNDLNCLFLGIY